MAELKNTGNRFFLLLIIVSVGAFMNPAWAQVQSPDEFLGYELGDYFTPHHRVMAYMNHVAEASDRVTAQVYGHTNERRELMLLTITSPDNHAIIDEIRTNNLKLTGLMDGEPTEEVRAIIWLSYNIHGNETSSSEAAMKTVYELASLSNTDVAHWLEDTVVIVDPMLNPDGRDRYVNWFNGIIGRDYNPHVSTREHHEPWPGGRPNHYYFDLNRDWAWQTQLETQQRSPMYQSWMPHVHVDFHEQGYNSPYYFAPAAEPFHKAITDWQREFQTTIGENNIRYFDAEGWHYFTRERFDLFYPSYGDTWPTFNGAIGMTYEQAGHGLAGASILTQEGDTLTLKDRLTHHHITGISTIEVTAEHADRVIREFQNHFDRARTNPAGRFKTYVVKADNDPDHIYALLRFLDSQNITYGRAGRSSSATGYDYRAGTERRVSVAEEDIIISAYQPQSQMVRVLFEPSPELSDSLTYDITAWESHHRFGLDGYALTDRINPGVTLEAESLRRFQVTGRERPYAYALPWTSMDDARFLADITKEGVRSRYSEVPFEVDGRAFPRGTLVITRDNNRHLGPDFDAIVQEAARTHSRSIHGASTGFVQRGSDFG
ncbi:MAG: M14 family metallopeptidase, partial [Balneolaceae bacterium]